MNHLNLIRKQEEVKRRNQMNRIGRYVRPGIHFIEKDTSGVEYSKRYLRKRKIGKIFNIDVPNVIITSTPKGGPTNFPQIW